jgi:superfamily I DNA/RNA helicase
LTDPSLLDLAGYGDGYGVWDQPEPEAVQPVVRVCQVYQLHGPPGCGKTSALARTWIPRAVELYGPQAVAVCSLTKTAAYEIASRSSDLDPENVGTLHALCYRALERPSMVVNHIKDWNKIAPAKYQLATGSVELALDNPDDRHRHEKTGDELLESVDLLRHRCDPFWEWPEEERDFHLVWTSWKRREGYYDFTDLIEQAVELTSSPRSNPSALIVDEAQDLSTLERQLVMHWSQSCEMLILAGDGDQSIYTWRGADAAAFAANDGIPQENQRELTQSYRVPGAVVEYAQQWIARHVGPRHPVAYKPRKDADGNIVVGSLVNASHMTLRGGIRPLVDDIEAQIAAGKNTMVLSTCAYMLRGLTAELRRRGLPFFNPFRSSNGAWNPMRGGVDRLSSFLRPRGGKSLWTWGELQQWTDYLRADPEIFRHGAKATIKRRIKNLSVEALSEPATTSEIRVVFTDDGLRTILELLEGDTIEAADWFMSNVLPRHKPLFSFASQIIRRRGIDALLETPKIVVGTVHSVKGGAADVVYLAPDISKTGAGQWDRGGVEADELVRVFYVGMTRARESLILLGGTSRDSIRWPL